MDSSKPIVMQIVPVKVTKSQNKTKRKECEMGPLEKEAADEGEREIMEDVNNQSIPYMCMKIIKEQS